MGNFKIEVVEKRRFPKRHNDCLAYCEIAEDEVKIMVKKNQTKKQKIQYILHELWEWGDRTLISRDLPDKDERKAIHNHATVMDAIAIKLIAPYL